MGVWGGGGAASGSHFFERALPMPGPSGRGCAWARRPGVRQRDPKGAPQTRQRTLAARSARALRPTLPFRGACTMRAPRQPVAPAVSGPRLLHWAWHTPQCPDQPAQPTPTPGDAPRCFARVARPRGLVGIGPEHTALCCCGTRHRRDPMSGRARSVGTRPCSRHTQCMRAISFGRYNAKRRPSVLHSGGASAFFFGHVEHPRSSRGVSPRERG